MRAYSLIAALVVTSSLSACGGGIGGGSGADAGPPAWFLRGHERQQAVAARATSFGGQRFMVATDQAPGVYRERMAGLIETCWINGDRNWRVERVPGGEALSLRKAAVGEEGPMEAIRLSMSKAGGPGLEVNASGPLASSDQRDRLRRALERAKTFNPQAPDCPRTAAS